MAIFSNTLLTFDQKGQREQLANIVYRIDPEDTPLTSAAAKENSNGVQFEWQTQALGAVDGANAHLEGDDEATYPAVTGRVRVGNICQISKKLFLVSETAEAVEVAGVPSEINEQTALKGAEMKRDIETILFANQGAATGSDTIARKTATLGAWVKTNVDKGTGVAADPTWTAGIPLEANKRTDGTQRAFTETIVKSVVQKCYTSGARTDGMRVFVGPVNKQKFSGFAGIATKTYNIEGRKPGQATVVAAADVYVSDFGTLVVMPSRFMRERDAYFIDPSMLSIKHLRPLKREERAKTGDARKFVLVQEWGLKISTEKGLGLAADLTTT